MTTSAEYNAKSKALKDELEKVEKAEAAARHKEMMAALIAKNDAYNKELEEVIRTHCYGVDKFKKEHPRAYNEALHHAKSTCEDETMECIAEEMDSIMHIVRVALAGL